MAAMVDLKMSKKKRDEFMKPESVSADQYPWGFRLSFDNEQVKKFPGLQDCKAGQKVMIHAEATITDLDEHATERGEKTLCRNANRKA